MYVSSAVNLAVDNHQRVQRTLRITGLVFLERAERDCHDFQSSEDPSAIKEVVAGYSEAFNHDDGRATASLFAEDADFTNMRGASRRGQK